MSEVMNVGVMNVGQSAITHCRGTDRNLYSLSIENVAGHSERIVFERAGGYPSVHALGLLGVPGCMHLVYQVVPRCTRCTMVFQVYQGVPRCSRCTRVYQGVPGVPGCMHWA